MRRSFALEVAIDRRTAADLRRLGRIATYPRLCFWGFACILILLVWRRCPTVISHALFWAEDGWVWYPQAYAEGWRCLLISHSGYLQTISRLVALLSLMFPLYLAPKVFAFAALAMQAAPAVFLVSSRLASAIPALRVRVALALLLVAIPGMSEVYVNLTNAQWHLSLLAFLILVAAPAVTRPQCVFDTLVLLISGLSGPFVVFLAPSAIMAWYARRGRWELWRLMIIAAAAAIQLDLILSRQASRTVPGFGIGWSLQSLINIVVTNVLGVATFGEQAMVNGRWLVGEGWLSSGGLLPVVIAALLFIGACILGAIAFLRGPWVLRSFLIFVGLEFAATLTDGLALSKPLWAALEGWIGGRYYFHPIAAWLVIMVRLICDRSLPLRTLGVGLMALTVVLAVPSDWALPKQPRTAFHDEAQAFAKAPPGTIMSFPVRPLHDMVLVKH